MLDGSGGGKTGFFGIDEVACPGEGRVICNRLSIEPRNKTQRIVLVAKPHITD